MNRETSIGDELTHALNVYAWLTKIKPKASAALIYAALLHDCDRLFPDKQVRQSDFPDYESYKRAHAKNCAAIADTLLARAGATRAVRAKIKWLIEDHEWGTRADSYALMAADSLSFFTVNILAYYRKRGERATQKKIEFMYSRLKQKERKLLRSSNLACLKIPVIDRLIKKAGVFQLPRESSL